MTPIEMLDTVLKWFSVDYSEIEIGQIMPRQSIKKDVAVSKMVEEFRELNTNEFMEYYPLIFDKLVNDGYLKKEHELYSITFEGKLFNSVGGYTERRKIQVENAENISRELILRKRNDRRLVIATFLAGFGALVLVIWDILKTFYFQRC